MTNLLPVKPFQETLGAGMCGPASLKMVFEYYGLEKTEKELAELCGIDPNLGTTHASMKSVAEGLGFTVELHSNSTFEDIEIWLGKKVPVIVDWFTPGQNDQSDSEMPDGHSSVVVGLDADFIYMQDPEIGRMRTIKRGEFMRVWFDFTGPYITSWDEMIIRELIAIYNK